VERVLKLYLVPRKHSSASKSDDTGGGISCRCNLFFLQRGTSCVRSSDILALATFYLSPLPLPPFSVQFSLYPPLALLAGCGLVVPPVLITECPSRHLLPHSVLKYKELSTCTKGMLF